MAISQSPGLDRAPTQRRSIRFSAPGPQLRLGTSVLAVTLAFGVLFAANSYAAYGRMFSATLSLAPRALVDQIAEQTLHYLGVSAVLVVGLVIAVVAVSAASLHRLLGPVVAIERHVRALASGNYAARLELRSGDAVFADVARRLNDLARDLERASPSADRLSSVFSGRVRQEVGSARAAAPRMPSSARSTIGRTILG